MHSDGGPCPADVIRYVELFPAVTLTSILKAAGLRGVNNPAPNPGPSRLTPQQTNCIKLDRQLTRVCILERHLTHEQF